MTNSKKVIDGKTIVRYKRWAVWSLVMVYMLFVIGGIVRATGSGMGCPDWPTCFGSWVPPTDVSQLPENYKEIYGAKLKGEIEFNAAKTWTEYINRLFGVTTGATVFFTLLASIPFLKTERKSIFYLSAFVFLLVAFQGWLGAKVVSFELLPVIVTLHMLVAVLIVFVLLYAYAKVSYVDNVRVEKLKYSNRNLNRWLLAAGVIATIQLILGAQVRELVDEAVVALGWNQRSQWLEHVGGMYYVHRSFSILVAISIAGLWYQIQKETIGKGIMHKLVNALVIVLVLEIISGIILGYFSVPAFLQPVHLTLASLLLGIQFVLFLFLNAERIFRKRNVGWVAGNKSMMDYD